MALCDIFFYFTHAGDAEKSKAVSYNCSELSADLHVKRNLSLLYILIVCLDTILILISSGFLQFTIFPKLPSGSNVP